VSVNYDGFIDDVMLCCLLAAAATALHVRPAREVMCWSNMRASCHCLHCCILSCCETPVFRPAGETGKGGRVSVNYDGFIDDVSIGDELLVDGGIISFVVTGKTDTDVQVGRVMCCSSCDLARCHDNCRCNQNDMLQRQPELI
jgi:hypothetical protein